MIPEQAQQFPVLCLLLKNQVLLAEIHILSAYMLSMAHVALQKLSRVSTTDNCLTMSELFPVFFLHRLIFTKPWATSFT